VRQRQPADRDARCGGDGPVSSIGLEKQLSTMDAGRQVLESITNSQRWTMCGQPTRDFHVTTTVRRLSAIIALLFGKCACCASRMCVKPRNFKPTRSRSRTASAPAELHTMSISWVNYATRTRLARAVQVRLQSLDDFLDMPDRSRDTWRRVSRLNEIQFRHG
jgi:hypothetical protein